MGIATGITKGNKATLAMFMAESGSRAKELKRGAVH